MKLTFGSLRGTKRFDRDSQGPYCAELVLHGVPVAGNSYSSPRPSSSQPLLIMNSRQLEALEAYSQGAEPLAPLTLAQLWYCSILKLCCPAWTHSSPDRQTGWNQICRKWTGWLFLWHEARQKATARCATHHSGPRAHADTLGFSNLFICSSLSDAACQDDIALAN
jgi:hypothetical protein